MTRQDVIAIFVVGVCLVPVFGSAILAAALNIGRRE